jgi:hypothetical protein
LKLSVRFITFREATHSDAARVLVYHQRAVVTDEGARFLNAFGVCPAASSTVSGGTEMNLPHNVGKTDKYVRIGAGIALIGLAATGTIGAWGFIGLVPLATGLLNTCPAYTLLGVDTSKPEEKI